MEKSFGQVAILQARRVLKPCSRNKIDHEHWSGTGQSKIEGTKCTTFWYAPTNYAKHSLILSTVEGVSSNVTAYCTVTAAHFHITTIWAANQNRFHTQSFNYNLLSSLQILAEDKGRKDWHFIGEELLAASEIQDIGSLFQISGKCVPVSYSDKPHYDWKKEDRILF